MNNNIRNKNNLKFKIGTPFTAKGDIRIFVADVVYSMVEEDWLVLYYSLDKKDNIVGSLLTINLAYFEAAL